MRYLVQFAIPILILMGVLILAAARRRPQGEPDAAQSDSENGYQSSPSQNSDAGTILAMLLIGAAVVIGLAVALQGVFGG